MNIATDISIHTSTSITDAMKMPVSLAVKVLESKSFDNYKRSRESEIKTQAAIVGRLNEVIRGLSNLSKSIRG